MYHTTDNCKKEQVDQCDVVQTPAKVYLKQLITERLAHVAALQTLHDMFGTFITRSKLRIVSYY